MSQEDALSLIINRNFFYRDNFRRVTFLLLVSMLVNGCLGMVALYNMFNPVPPQFIVTTPDGRLFPLEPLSQPVKSGPMILAWANMAATRINAYDFVHYKRQLQDASNYFTESGWRNYRQALLSSKNLDYVRENRLVVSSVATGTPVITQQGLVDGVYTWRVSLPLLLNYKGATVSRTQPAIVSMMIQRESVEKNPSGIGIVFYRAKVS